MKKIILVENKRRDLRSTIKTLLEKHNYRVITSPNRDDCLKKIEKGETPDLILIDSTMSRRGLFEIAKKLKNVKIVYLVVDKGDTGDLALYTNVVGFIEEPRDINEFITKIDKITKEK